MKILQTISNFSILGGGTTTCTYDLISALRRIGVNVDLMTVRSEQLAGNGESWIKALENNNISPYGFSFNINRFLKESNYDLYHTNGLWMHCNHQTCVEARKKQKPYIITPHGMLYPQALARSSWKKKILFSLGGVDKDLKRASCIHVTCETEMKYYRDLGYRNPVAVIPNPVHPLNSIKEIERKNDIKRIGFLGRLHPRKNIELLIDAWVLLGDKVKDAQLLIMGSGDKDYENKLKEKVISRNISNIIFLGFVSGYDKYRYLASLTALCVPSDFENFGMIVTEALSVGTPVIASFGTPWELLNTRECGWWVANDKITLVKTIEHVLSLQPSILIKMGENGKKLVSDEFCDIEVAKKMELLYNWVINGGEKPNFVYL